MGKRTDSSRTVGRKKSKRSGRSKFYVLFIFRLTSCGTNGWARKTARYHTAAGRCTKRLRLVEKLQHHRIQPPGCRLERGMGRSWQDEQLRVRQRPKHLDGVVQRNRVVITGYHQGGRLNDREVGRFQNDRREPHEPTLPDERRPMRGPVGRHGLVGL